MSDKSTIPYERYAPLFDCYLKYYNRRERIYAFLGHGLNFSTLLAQFLTTLIQIQSDENHLFGDEASTRTIAYWSGFLAIFLAGLGCVLPFEKSASQYRYASTIMARYLTTREPLPRYEVHNVYEIDTIFMPSVGTYRDCRMVETSVEIRSRQGTDSTPSVNSSTASRRKHTRQGDSAPFREYAPILVCANDDFKTHALTLFRVYYFLTTIELFSISATAVFHNNPSLGMDTSDERLQLVMVISGIVGTLASAVVAAVPFRDVAEQCMNAHGLINEYILSEDELPMTVLNLLYATPTLFSKNPLLSMRCLKVADA